jgi:hypothetical protein
VKATQAENAKQTRDRSQQVTSEYKASHKVKFAVSREQGSESKTTRKIKNINRAHTLNVNYYEVLNRYQVSLSLTSVPLAMLGPEADLAADVRLGDEPIHLGVIAMQPAGRPPKFTYPSFPPDVVVVAPSEETSRNQNKSYLPLPSSPPGCFSVNGLAAIGAGYLPAGTLQCPGVGCQFGCQLLSYYDGRPLRPPVPAQ